MLTPKQQQVMKWRESGTPMVFMVAPSFPVDYQVTALIPRLRALGGEVTELTFGAKMVNISYARYISQHPDQRFYISSPCPLIVNQIKLRYPTLVPYLVPVVSPMIAMARIGKKYYPEHKIIMISPCLAKEPLELSRYPGEVDLHLTFKELTALLAELPEPAVTESTDVEFDHFVSTDTKIYPLSGGLAHSARLSVLFKETEIKIIDGPAECTQLFDQMSQQPETVPYRFIDVLSCPGGCVGGQGLNNARLSLVEKETLIWRYREEAQIKEETHCQLIGDPTRLKDMDFSGQYWQ